MLDTMTMGSDGSDLMGGLRPRRRRSLPSLRSYTLTTFVVSNVGPDGRPLALNLFLWLCPATRWERMGIEDSEPGLWCVIRVGPLVLAAKVTV